MNSNNRIIEEKINVLLRWNIHESEQRLVAILLLTRIEHPSHVLQKHPELVEFLCQLIRRHPHKHSSLLYSYIRLASQLLPACCCLDERSSSPSCLSFNSPTTPVPAIANELIESLLAYDHLNNNDDDNKDTQWTNLSIEILMSLNDYLEKVNDHGVLDETLYRIWERSTTTESTPTSSLSTTPDTRNLDRQEHQHYAQKLMDETLDKLLNQTTSVAPIVETNNKKNSVHQMVELYEMNLLQLLEHHGQRLMVLRRKQSINTCLPKFWKSLLEDWMQTAKKNHAPQRKQISRIQAARLLLVLLQNFCHQQQLSLLQHEVTMISQMVALVLACVVATTSSTDELRTVAWSTIATWMDSEWEWLFHTKPIKTKIKTITTSKKNNLSLGKCQNLCTIIRLAAGEWKIQLEKELKSFENDQSDQNASCNHVLLSEYCAKVLIQTISNIVVPMSESNADWIKNWTGDAILHLRQSLDEAQQAAIEYMGLAKANQNTQIDGVVVRVLASLWTEFDIFEQNPFPNTYESDNHTEEQEQDACSSKLQALKVAIQVSVSDVGLQEQLFPCLTAIYASAEDDVSRIALLRQNGLMGDDILLDFWDRYWDRTTNIAVVSWACQWMELYIGMEAVVNIKRIQGALVRFLQRALSQSHSPQMVNPFSSVLGCYIILQGDEPPTEPDASILQSTIEYCAHFDGNDK
jgi:hypothetical protein